MVKLGFFQGLCVTICNMMSQCYDVVMTTWTEQLAETKQADYFVNCLQRVAQERASGKTIYPPKDKVFEAFRLCELSDIKVVIIGQDPYHGPNQAHGLCFSVNKGIPLPPSLKNIYQELQTDLNLSMPVHGDLRSWAEQGVFLLNTVLTVQLARKFSLCHIKLKHSMTRR